MPILSSRFPTLEIVKFEMKVFDKLTVEDVRAALCHQTSSRAEIFCERITFEFMDRLLLDVEKVGKFLTVNSNLIDGDLLMLAMIYASWSDESMLAAEEILRIFPDLHLG